MKNNTSVISTIMILLLVALTGLALYVLNNEVLRHYTIGIVNPNSSVEPVIDGFKAGLAEEGYIEGKNITYLYDGALNSNAEIEPLIHDLLLKDPDMIFTLSTPAALRAKKMTEKTGTPVVFNLYSALRSGVVKSLSFHGSNLTGVQTEGSAEKALEWLLLAAPGVKKVLVPVSFDTKAAGQSLAALQEGAEKLNLEIVVSEVDSPDDLSRVLSERLKEVDALFVINSILIVSNVQTVVQAGIAHKLPVGASTEQYKRGALITYGQNHFRTGKRIGHLAHKILEGTSPAYLPVENAEFFLGVNLKTASAIGIDMPDEILKQADFIIR